MNPRTLIAIGAVGLAACGAPTGPVPAHAPAEATAAAPAAATSAAPRASVVVAIKDFAYAPPSLTVTAGTTVTWRNLDDEPHTVRGADAMRSDALDRNDEYHVKFDRPGTYLYGCSIHPKMKGIIVVQPSAP